MSYEGNMSEEERQQQQLRQMRTCQTLNMVALIGAPVSLIIGGLALSIAALVCAIVSYVKMRRIISPNDPVGSIQRTLYKQSTIALVASSVCAALSVVAFAYMFGAVMQALQTGDISSVFDSFGSTPAETSSPDKSIWD